MTTAKDDSVTTPVDEAEVDAEAERLFAEAVEAREGKPADAAAGDADEGATATTQGDEEAEATTTGEGEPGDDQEGQSGGSEGAAAEAAASGEGDIWADADPKLKAAYEAALSERNGFEQKFKSREGREAALQRQIADLRRQGGGEEQQRKPLKELLAAENITALKEEYPDFAPLIDALAEAGERVDGVAEQVGEARTTAVTAVTAHEERALNEAVPNWLELAKDERFLGWVEDQPRKVRDAVSANWNAITNAKDAAEVFNAFAEHIKPAEAKTEETDSGGKPGKRDRQQQGARAATVNAPASAGGDSDDPEVAWAQAAAKIDKRRGLRT